MVAVQLRVVMPIELSNQKNDCMFLQRRKKRWTFCSLFANSNFACIGQEPEKGFKLPIYSSLVANPVGEVTVSSEQKVYDVVLKQAALVEQQMRKKADFEVKADMLIPGTTYLLKEAYDRCGRICAEYAKTFYLG